MAEPLRLFRDHVQNKISMREITVNGTVYYAFGDTAYPATTLTSLKNLTNEYYSLESIVWFWRYISEQHANYVRDVSARGIKPDYLHGYTRDEIEGFDLNAPVAVPVSYATLLAQEQERKGEPEIKRPRLDNKYCFLFIRQKLLIRSFSVDGFTVKNENSAMEVDEKTSTNNTMVRDLGPALPAEKVAQLRNSVQKNRKHQTKSSTHPTFDEMTEPLADLKFDVASDLVMKALIEMEIPSCSRNELYARNADFDAVHGYFELKTKPAPLTQTNGHATAAPQNRSSQRIGYSRYDQEVFRAEPETDFQIETNLSFHGSSLNAIRGGTLGAKAGNDSQISDTGADGRNNGRETEVREGFGPRNAFNPNGRPPKPKNLRPIIIIPASGTALITMYNAEDILQDLRYVSTEERKKTKRREYELVIHRNKGNNKTAAYQVIDDPRKLRDEDWDRIVAVFVQGPSWQFKGWKYNQQPTEIFSKMCAFHLKFKEQPLDKNVEKWSVTRLELSQTQRHLDRAVLHKFWEKLDMFMTKNKSHLRF
ncbi:Parafibromin [Aphelenchoides besseyi]|nr:Parafibromin [Aphelenchoides besseyi]